MGDKGPGFLLLVWIGAWVCGGLIVKALPWLEPVLLFGVVASLGIFGLMWKAFVVVVYFTVFTLMWFERPVRYRRGGRG